MSSFQRDKNRICRGAHAPCLLPPPGFPAVRFGLPVSAAPAFAAGSRFPAAAVQLSETLIYTFLFLGPSNSQK